MSDQESISETLRIAHLIVVDLKLDAEFRPVAYSKAIDLLSADKVVSSLTPAAPRTGAPGGTNIQPAAEIADSTSKLARALGVDAEVLELVYVIAGDQLDLVLSRSKLPKERFPAMRTLTILVAAGRQALGLDEGWTPVEVIRNVCRDFGMLDASNFAAAVSAVGDAFVIRGKGAQRQVKVTRAGFEEAGRLILQLVGSVR